MRSIIFAYFDKKLGIYGNPSITHECSNDDLIENTRRMCANPRCPEVYFDYELYILGHYDDKLGLIEPLSKPEFVVSLNDFRYLKAEVSDNVSKS